MKKNSELISVSMKKASAALCLSALFFSPVAMQASLAVDVPSQAVLQGRSIKGKIIDESGEPMIGVTVKVIGSKAAVVTDLDGNFSIAARTGDQLEISYVGYKTVTVKAGSTPLKVTMEPETTSLEDVVVIG